MALSARKSSLPGGSVDSVTTSSTDVTESILPGGRVDSVTTGSTDVTESILPGGSVDSVTTGSTDVTESTTRAISSGWTNSQHSLRSFQNFMLPSRGWIAAISTISPFLT